MRYFLPLIITCCLVGQPRTVWLYGDSISRGWGLGEFEYPSPINSVWGIANLLAAENGHPEITVRWRGYQDPQRLWLDRHENIVAGGDVIIFENAGPHFGPEAYRLWLQLWRESAGDNRLILTTTPDNRPAGDINDYSTINPVVREEATSLLDWEVDFERLEPVAQEHGVSLMHPDGIHPNAFGNFVMAVSILRGQGVEIERYDSVLAEFERYYPSTGDILESLRE